MAVKTILLNPTTRRTMATTQTRRKSTPRKNPTTRRPTTRRNPATKMEVAAILGGAAAGGAVEFFASSSESMPEMVRNNARWVPGVIGAVLYTTQKRNKTLAALGIGMLASTAAQLGRNLGEKVRPINGIDGLPYAQPYALGQSMTPIFPSLPRPAFEPAGAPARAGVGDLVIGDLVITR